MTRPRRGTIAAFGLPSKAMALLASPATDSDASLREWLARANEALGQGDHVATARAVARCANARCRR
jgi:hypothetical protein